MLDSHRIAVLCSVLLTASAIATRAEPLTAAQPSFDVDVMAVLSKAGCNAGACHGNQNGKGGLRLSLRGQDSQFDYLAIVNELAGRRIDRFQPEQSLLLLKPMAEIAHQGGKRFDIKSPEYAMLCQWIGDGAPGPDPSSPRVDCLDVSPAEQIVFAPRDEVQLRVTARFSDGTVRDVTRMAVYEPSHVGITISVDGLAAAQTAGEFTVGVRYLDQQEPVRLAFLPARPNFRWSEPREHNYVDRHIFAKLQRLRVNPSELCTDEVFVRRASLDALGVLPTAEEARQFVFSNAPEKRTQLIDRLLSRPEFADHWALKWSDVLRNEEKVLDRHGVEVFYRWIRKNVAEGRPLNEFVRELISARGSTYLNAPANFHRANRDPTTRGEAVARVFLGTRLQCAKCHNHPFDRWTQDDYYAWAATFARIDYKIVDNKRLDKLDKNEFVGEQVVLVKEEGEVQNPNTQQDVAPRFLGEDATLPEDSDRLNELAAWLASPENTAFARAQVNRVWYHLMGRGLVDPVDDFRDTNPPSHPELLNALAEDFIAGGFHLRHLVRVIMLSRTYQLSSLPNETNMEDDTNFSRAIVRRLSAEQLLDAQSQVLGVPAKFNGHPDGLRAGQIPGVRKVRLRDDMPSDGDRFLFAFGKPERQIACECERSESTTLSQALMLVSGQGLHELLTDGNSRLASAVEQQTPTEEVVESLYWSALSRAPTQAEQVVARELLQSGDDRLATVQDLAWALLNAKEFVFRH